MPPDDEPSPWVPPVAVFILFMLIWVLGTLPLFVGAVLTADPPFGGELTAQDKAELPWRLLVFALCAILPPAGCLWIAVHRRWRWMAWSMTVVVLVGAIAAIAGIVFITT
jgi:hypothetical protein